MASLNTNLPPQSSHCFSESDLNVAERRRCLYIQRKDWSSQTEMAPFYFCRPLIMDITIEHFSLSYLIRNQKKRREKPSNKKSAKSRSQKNESMMDLS